MKITLGKLPVLFLFAISLAPSSATAGYHHKWTVFPQDDRIKVVTSVPVLAGVAKQIGGKSVAVVSLTKSDGRARESRISKSMIKAVDEATVLLRLDTAIDTWVDVVIKRAHNSAVSPGASGYSSCLMGAGLATEAKQGQSDSIPYSPLSPEVRKAIAQNILAALIRVSPNNEGYFRRNYQRMADTSPKTADKTQPPYVLGGKPPVGAGRSD